MTTLAPENPTFPPAPLPRPHAYTSQYAELLGQIKGMGLLERRRGFYITLMVLLTVAMVGTFVAMASIGASWWQLALAPVLGILFTQFAFLGHELAHKQVFTSGPLNDALGQFLAHFVVGISYSWWNNKHSRHHQNPNTIGKDPDIDSDVIAFQDDQAQSARGLQRKIVQNQGWLFFPLLTLEGINLHVQGLKRAFSAEHFPGRSTEISLLLARHAVFIGALFFVMPPGIALAFLAIELAVFGVYMGASFAPNHKGMPLIPAGEKVDFLRRQVLTSRNIRGGRFMDFLFGGLNYQVEHHLFPNMPRPSLQAAATIVREYCKTHAVRYTETSLLQSYVQVIQYLNRVGLRARDPFECPVASLGGR